MNPARRRWVIYIMLFTVYLFFMIKVRKECGRELPIQDYITGRQLQTHIIFLKVQQVTSGTNQSTANMGYYSVVKRFTKPILQIISMLNYLILQPTRKAKVFL